MIGKLRGIVDEKFVMNSNTKDKQTEKYSKGLSGELFVAAQLQRQGIFSSITYGNAKQADVMAFLRTDEENVFSAMFIEVKSTDKSKWKVGGRAPKPSDQLWVFVHIPTSLEKMPDFFILTQTEIHHILKPIEDEYFRKYKERHGEEYGDKPGFATISLEQLNPHKNRWDKIKARCAG